MPPGAGRDGRLRWRSAGRGRASVAPLPFPVLSFLWVFGGVSGREVSGSG